MPNSQIDLIGEIAAFFSKSSAYLLSIFMGLMGTIGFDLMVNKRYSWKQRLGVLMVSIFFGAMGSLVCEYHDFGVLKYLIPSLSTMFGQYIALYVHKNYKHIGDTLIYFFTKKPQK
jgi:hypothetical protein